MPVGTSPEQQRKNQEALAQAARNISAVLRAGYGPLSTAQAMTGIGVKAVSAVKLQLSKPGGGRTYTTRFYTDKQGRLRAWGTRPPHTASAPGQSPAVDTGLLRSSYNFQVGTRGGIGGAYVDVGTAVKYAPFLEFGTSKMKARPHLRPAIVKVHKEISKEAVKHIGKTMANTVKAMGGTVGGRVR